MAQSVLMMRIGGAIELWRRSLDSRSSLIDVSDQLVALLNTVLPSRFKAMRAHVVAHTGQGTAEFLAVVFDTERFDGKTSSVPANAAAAVIAGSANIGLNDLSKAYE